MIKVRDYVAALRVVKQYHKQTGLLVKSNEDVLPADTLLADCKLSVRAHNCLFPGLPNFEEITLSGLSQIPINDLMNIKKLGIKTVEELADLLVKAGLHFNE
ncbi:DNA-directed RNA polymerase subunit alpha C-terminal domain-containing protein [Spirosoma spitsbergense]|uniref:DNA-directed RNA polymerase subunit alpha C-terminal domain-containing protein n=1 Tax=Spirosoma spitsbergense TaxID=431554 RepID=UPI00039EE1B8|nr:DNA-directed RNA polymerase subunit alpha C-terminal domain-containing protein [Spirosoma spitsbergense]